MNEVERDGLSGLLDAAAGGGEAALSALSLELAEMGLPEDPEGVEARFQLLLVRQKGTSRVLKEVAERFAAAEIARLFEEWPALESFGWRQYAPSWSEGETGVQEARLDEMTINGQEGPHKGNSTLARMYRAALKPLRFLGDDLLVEIYGESRSVKVSREGGVETDWYWDED